MESTTPTVVCAGSLHYDILVKAPRLPKLSETLVGTDWYPKFGGKGGNQAVAAARNGVAVRMLGAVGRDAFGARLRSELASAGVDCGFLHEIDGSTGMSVAISEENGEYGAVIVSGVNQRIPMDAIRDPSLWANACFLMLQNELPHNFNALAAAEAKSNGIKVCLNAAPCRELDDEFASRVDLLVVNALEAEQLFGRTVNSRGDARNAAGELLSIFPSAIVTAGPLGLGGACRMRGSFEVVAEEVTGGNAHGAGDVFTGTLCAKLANGSEIEAAAACASSAAARHVAASARSLEGSGSGAV